MKHTLRNNIRFIMLIIAGSVFVLLVIAPKTTLAANIYVTSASSSVAVGDTVVVNIMMDPTDKRPNVVEGNIDIKGDSNTIAVSDFSLGGSVLTEWPNTPSLDTSSSISFVGGVPGGFGGNSGLLFKIIFLAQHVGQITISPENILAYNNDASATPVSVSLTPLTITIASGAGAPVYNEWTQITSEDHQAPQDLTATVGQDNGVFGGKKFLTLSATDAQSGLDYYEVQEGNFPAVHTGNTYVLQDQTGRSRVTVSVYDKAGNVTTISLTPEGSTENYVFWLFVSGIIVVIGVFVLLIWIFIRKRLPIKSDDR